MQWHTRVLGFINRFLTGSGFSKMLFDNRAEAPAGYGRNVTKVRWTSNLSQDIADNTGNVSSTARIR